MPLKHYQNPLDEDRKFLERLNDRLSFDLNDICFTKSYCDSHLNFLVKARG